MVPSPVLKSSLDDMALDIFNPENQFADSDDEDDDGTSRAKKKGKCASCDDEFSGSLSVKPGRNTNTTLYYCDYSKLSNSGNGLLPDDRNTLLSDHESAKAEYQAKSSATQSMTTETTKLLSEPTNEDATTTLEEDEELVSDLRDKVESAQELKNFDKTRIKLKKKIDVMTAQWRKRRRMCMDFLMAMEDNTEGTISVKKCLSGDGQIYIGKFHGEHKYGTNFHTNLKKSSLLFILILESDTVAIKGQKEYATNKRRRGAMGKQMVNKRQKKENASISGIPANEAFIGVDLNARGFVDRIYLED